MGIQTITSAEIQAQYNPPPAPPTAEAEGQPATPVVGSGAETVDGAPVEYSAAQGQARGPDGKFTSADEDMPEKVQQRINAKHRAMKEAEEAWEIEFNLRQEAEKKAAVLEDRLKQLEQRQAPAETPANAKPDPKDFTDAAAYAEALADWKVREALAERDRKQAEDKARADADAANKRLVEQAERAKQTFEDFEEVTRAAHRSGLVIPPHVQAAILESDYGAELAYTLAKDAKEAKRIFGLPAAKALLELGKLETRFERAAEKAETAAAATPVPPKTTRAPPPITPVRGESAGPEAMDLSRETDFRRYRDARLAQQRSARRR